MMKVIQDKFANKEFVQNFTIEFVADVIMLVVGLIIGYYIRVMLF
jgi:hypothetical protein